MTNSHFSKQSKNIKVVGKTKDGKKLQSVTTTGRQSCPDGCEHKGITCYADEGFLPMHWNKVSNGERGTDF